MKKDLNDIFTDIDDKLIAQAKPMAQKPTELRSETRPKIALWKKLSVAAACLTAVAVGGAFAVKGISSTSDVQQSAVITPNDSGHGAPANSGVSLLESTLTDKEGQSYQVISSKSFNGVNAYVGLRQKVYGRGSFVLGMVAVKNTTDKPVVFAKENGTNVKVDGLNKCVETENYYSDEEPAGDTDVIEPGKTYYKWFVFDTCKTDRYGGGADIDYYKTKDLVEGGTYKGTLELAFLSDPEDPSSEVISNTLDFDVEIGDYNSANEAVGNIKYGSDLDQRVQRWGPDKFTIRGDFPDEFECDHRSIYLLNADGTKTRLFGGKYILGVDICDLNGDGYGEIIASVAYEADEQNAWGYKPIVYDHANKRYYTYVYNGSEPDYDISAGFKPDAGTSGMGGRAMLGVGRRNDQVGSETIYQEPLKFDMLTPCVIDKDGAPVAAAVDPNGGTDGVIPQTPADGTSFPGIDAVRENTLEFARYFKQKWYHGKEIVYNGKTYKVYDMGATGSASKDPETGEFTGYLGKVLAVRRETINGQDTLEMLSIIENRKAEPETFLAGSAADGPVLFKCVRSAELTTEDPWDDIVAGLDSLYTVDSGETVYQTAAFPITDEEYKVSVCMPYSFGGQFRSNSWVDFGNEDIDNDDVYRLFGGYYHILDDNNTSDTSN